MWVFAPTASARGSPALAFIFSPFYSLEEHQGGMESLLICIIPRILVGTVAGLVHRLLKKLGENNPVRYALAGALGSLTNTVLVLGGIWLFFGDQYATVLGAPLLSIIGLTVLTNGLPEAVVSAIVAPAVGIPLAKIKK